ncbi:MAG: hypothetical protein OXS28_02395 [Gammaproteobacteria bacterium]|nr:hypothetical protein [Gammaproteobacteria bacterium]
MSITAKEILDYLNEVEIRCTYGAFGELIGTPAKSVARKHLGERRPEASWVVNGEKGRPTGYLPGELHPNLFKNEVIIRTGKELKRKINEFQKQKTPAT